MCVCVRARACACVRLCVRVVRARLCARAQVLSAALGQGRADFASDMGRALSLETHALAYESDQGAIRRRRGLLCLLAVSVTPAAACRDSRD